MKTAFVRPAATVIDAAKIEPLDLALAMTCLVTLNALALQTYGDYLHNAHLSEAVLNAGHARIEIVERLAHSGEPVDMPGGASEDRVQRAASDHLKGPEPGMLERVKGALQQAAGPAPGDPERREVSRYVERVRTEGSTVLLTGQLGGGGGGNYTLALSPMVQDGHLPQVLVWQCVHQAMPHGWTGPTVVPHQPPPQAWLPARCRPSGLAR